MNEGEGERGQKRRRENTNVVCVRTSGSRTKSETQTQKADETQAKGMEMGVGQLLARGEGVVVENARPLNLSDRTGLFGRKKGSRDLVSCGGSAVMGVVTVLCARDEHYIKLHVGEDGTKQRWKTRGSDLTGQFALPLLCVFGVFCCLDLARRCSGKL